MQFAATCTLLEVRPMRLIIGLPAHDAGQTLAPEGSQGPQECSTQLTAETPVVRRFSTETNFDPAELWAGSGIRPTNSPIV